jgi:murein DD-endopeptidase MepM/ murein hydrolase activator NlpD
VFAAEGLQPTDEASVDVVPIRFRSKTRLTLPLRGPVLVYDGHDFYSHHRRIPLGGALARQAGLTTNPVRYANDLMPVGPAGELTHGPVVDPKSWYSYGVPVIAPADGEVVLAAGTMPDNRIENGEPVAPPGAPTDELLMALGNHVILKHAEGEFSVLAHLAPGSVTVRPGQRVKRGQPLGRIGFSGDTGLHVHVHYMLVTKASFDAEGIPAYFDRVRRVALPRDPAARPPIHDGFRLDTGDLVEAVP